MGRPLFLVRRETAGALIIGDTVYDTVQCQHCGAHWVPERGSGRVRGWCMRCNGPTCGAEPCETTCQTQEQLIEAIEAAARMEQSLAVLRGA